jgi:serine/threonine-protein kinase
VKSYPDEVRQLLDAAEDDFAVNRANGRESTRLVGPDGARLLELFRAPQTIVQAVLALSRDQGMDAEDLLNRAYPLLAELATAGFLVPAFSPRRQRTETTFAPGSVLGAYRIVRCIQVVEDSEVYQARMEQGLELAIKLGRQGFEHMLQYQIMHEAAVLQELDGRDSPRFIEAGVLEDGRPFLATAWCDGTEATVVAAEARAAGNRCDLLDLLGNVARAYAHLHECGILHGDIHPRNVLVDRSGSVTLIDFGLAVRIDSAPRGTPQGGLSFFSDPTFAAACLKDADPPQPSPKGEQYAVAALLYYLATGHHYIDFSLQREATLRQIVEEAPLLFAARGIAAWPEVESVLTRGLEKDPGRRFPDTAAMADALQEIDPSGPPAETPARKPSTLSDFLEGLVAELDMEGSLLRDGLSNAPICSIYVGAGGIAYAFCRLASTLGDPRHLATADVWIEKAIRDLHREDAFANAAMDVTPATVGRVSPYHTVAGVHLARALIAHALDDRERATEATADFLRESAHECPQPDLTLGRCGTVMACALLLEAFDGAAYPGVTDLTLLGDDRLRALWDEVATIGGLDGAKDWANLGIAHGWAGLLYVTLRWYRLRDHRHHRQAPRLLEAVKSRLDELMVCTWSTGRGLSLPWRDRPGATDRWMPGWCNGSAGLVHLGCLAHATFGDEHYLDFAERAAWTAWEVEGGVVDLCCGLAGRAYSLLELYRATDEVSWVRRAERLARRAVEDAPVLRDQEHPRHSLYKGELGLAVLIADLEDPHHASMPLFGSESVGD